MSYRAETDTLRAENERLRAENAALRSARWRKWLAVFVGITANIAVAFIARRGGPVAEMVVMAVSAGLWSRLSWALRE